MREVGACCCVIIREGVVGQDEVTGVLVIVGKRIIIGGEVTIHSLGARFKRILHCLITTVRDFNGEEF